MPQSSNEGKVLLALQALQDDPKLSMRRASQIYEIGYSTLRDRKNGVQSKREITVKSRNLSNLEEEVLLESILDLDLRGFPPQIHIIEEMANRLLADRGASPVGKLWANNFINRQPELKMRFPQRHDHKGALCNDPTIIRNWFKLVENIIAKYGNVFDKRASQISVRAKILYLLN
jgi:hypothetical protein